MRVANMRKKYLQRTFAKNLEWKRKTTPTSSLEDIAINLYSKVSSIILYIACGTHANDRIISGEQFVGTYLLDLRSKSRLFWSERPKALKSTALRKINIFLNKFFEIFSKLLIYFSIGIIIIFAFRND